MVRRTAVEGGGGKTIRTKRDKSVVNSIKVLMFARSANTHTHIAHCIRPGCILLHNRLRPPRRAIAVICQVSFRTGRRCRRRRSCSRITYIYSSSSATVSSAPRHQNLKPIIILYTYTKLVPVHKYTCICSDIIIMYTAVVVLH